MEIIVERVMNILDYINGLKNDLFEKEELIIKILDEINKVINRDLINFYGKGVKCLIGVFERICSNYNVFFGIIIGLSLILFIILVGFIVNSLIELMYLKVIFKI